MEFQQAVLGILECGMWITDFMFLHLYLWESPQYSSHPKMSKTNAKCSMMLISSPILW